MKHLRTFLAIAVSILPASTAYADATTDAIVNKAIKAHGGADKLDRGKAIVSKSKGTMHVGGMAIDIQQENVFHQGKFKEELKMTVMGQEITVTVGYDGKDGWINANGMDVPVEEKVLTELQEASYGQKLGRLTFLKDKSVELSALPETKVNGKPAVGVKVASKDRRTVDLYFDKETGLLARIDREALDQMSGNLVKEERIILEFMEVDGVKVPKKVLVNRDGNKFIEAEVQEVKYLDKVEDNTFKKP